MAPSGIFLVASVTDTTHGMPSSRETITAWVIWAPTSTTTAAAGTNSGVHAGSVTGATSTSPGSSANGSDGSVTMRARPVAVPAHPGMPVKTVPGPTFSTAAAASRRLHVESGGTSQDTMNGGSSSNSDRYWASRSRTTDENGAGSATNSSSSSLVSMKICSTVSR